MIEDRRSSDVRFFVGVAFAFLIAVLVAWLIINQSVIESAVTKANTEVRILQMHVQDQNAILIRQGLKQPGDSTTGPTNPDKLQVKNERDTM